LDPAKLADHITNPYGVKNEETGDRADIDVGRQLRQTWPDFHYDGQSTRFAVPLFKRFSPAPMDWPRRHHGIFHLEQFL
jgi:hypothetical protein